MLKVFGAKGSAVLLPLSMFITAVSGAPVFAQVPSSEPAAEVPKGEVVPQNTAPTPPPTGPGEPTPGTGLAPTTKETNAPAKAKPENIVVTGSRIKRIDAENAVPTKILRQEDFDKAGITSITELLQNQTENTFGSFNGGGGYTSVGQTSISLHGLGRGRTLVLVNGRRLPVEASLGGTNINNIPLAMVDRVEVLKASAAAVYGADAIAGVINVILKKAVTGSEVSTKANVSHEQGGESLKASAVTGFNVWDTDVTLAVGGGKTNRILTRDRDKLWGAAPPYDNSTAGAPPGTYSWGLLNPARPSAGLGDYVYRPSANCPVENQISFPNDPTATLCRGKLRDVSTGELMPEKIEKFVTLNLERNFGEVAVSTTVLGSAVNTSSYSVNRTLTANPARTGAYALPFGQTPADLKAQAAGLGYTDDQLIKISAPRLFPVVKGNTESEDTSLGIMTSLEGEISSEWDWHFDVSHFITKRSFTYHKAPDRLAFVQNLFPVAATGIPAINIFTDDLSQISNYFADIHSEETNGTTGATAYASGPVFELSGGTANLAAGVSATHEKYSLHGDDKDSQFLKGFPETAGIEKARYLGSFSSEGEGKRDLTSAFVELGMPVHKQMELSLTGRFDHYSDFGDTFNYGASAVAAPWTGLKFRASAGSGFRAPSLAELYNKADGGYLTVTDLKYCDNAVPADNPCGSNGKTYSVFVNSPGNGNLEEEISISYNIGVVIEPVDIFDISFDYWSAKIDDIIGQEELDKLIEKEISGAPLGPSTINRGTDGRIGSIDRSFANLGKLTSQGYDVASHLNLRAADLKYGLASSYSRILSAKSRPTALDPLEESVGAYGAPRYRMINSIFVDNGIHSASFDVTSIARQEAGNFDNDPAYGYISPESLYNVSYGWKYMDTGSLSLGVYNIENRITSLYVSDRETRDVAFNRQNNDVRGRQYQIGVKQAF